MIKFALGVLVTLAVLYPDVTKSIVNKTVDTTNTVVTETINNVK